MDEIIGQLAGLFLLVFALPVYKIARRKGVSTRGIILGFVIGLFPFAIVAVGIWWASLPDKALLDKISQLEGRH